MDYLILVNKQNKLGLNYIPKKLKKIKSKYNLGKNNLLNKKAKHFFEKMAKEALKENIVLKNISAYRSYDYQKKLYNNYKNNNLKNIDMISAKAGFSEHQTGLALDINNDIINFKNTKEYKWLLNNSFKYGFILRYPKGKEYITGYNFEPWHFRFVLIKNAKIMYKKKLTLEEYLS